MLARAASLLPSAFSHRARDPLRGHLGGGVERQRPHLLEDALGFAQPAFGVAELEQAARRARALLR